MEKLKLHIKGLSYSQSQSGAYALILGEDEGKRRLPIIIGGFEAQAIAIELEKMKPTRPLTHDLFKNFADTFKIQVTEVIINKFKEGVFYAQLICWNGNEETVIDSRTSDAVALAIRFECPIYTYETIMSQAGIVIDEETESEKEEESSDPLQGVDEDQYSQYSLNELKDLLKKAVEKEEYEKASSLRDEINKRKSQGQ
ncbi:MAG: DUF151 domain-containing protein [Bacteroidales bacterium]|nr:DUF151 domain-containing protein [Bacteroidales bacterium]